MNNNKPSKTNSDVLSAFVTWANKFQTGDLAAREAADAEFRAVADAAPALPYDEPMELDAYDYESVTGKVATWVR